jgi:23S rRNA (cytosine1962-C5)-methyltransferase
MPQTMNRPQQEKAEAAGRRTGRPASQLPVILETAGDGFYCLLDSGNGLKLERAGDVTLVRPEAQAIWQPRLPQSVWDKADAVFTGDADEEGAGRWRFRGAPRAETWPLQWEGLSCLGRFTSFRHVGVFPEQAAHWRFIRDRIAAAGRPEEKPVRLLNLFAYTGMASLVAASAGAHVTHVDASKRANQWARENQEQAGLEDAPIRWICDDAVKFCEREARRGNTYQAILLDPPKYGRGPKGEIWQILEDLPRLMQAVRSILADDALFVVLTAYSIRFSFFALHELMLDTLDGRGGRVESGELVIAGEDERRLSTSLFSRWVAA